MRNSKPKKFVDMFAGLGGFHVGLTRLGHHCVFACERDSTLQKTYELNFGLKPHSDIRKLRLAHVPAHDIMCAGFPCQPFSKAGEQLGLNCKKDGDLFRYLLRVIKYHKPTYLILENVANLARHNNGKTYEGMRKKLESLGYTIDQRVLSPHRFGIPQIRSRLFIVGSLIGLDNFEWIEGSNRPPSIISVLDDNPPDTKQIPEHYKKCIAVWQEFLDLFPKDEELPSFPIWSMEFGATYPFESTPPAVLGLKAMAEYKGSHGKALRGLSSRGWRRELPSHARGRRKFPEWKQQFIRQNRDLYAKHRRWIDKWLPKILEFPPSLQKLEWNCKGLPRKISKYILQFRASGLRIKRSSTAPALIAMTTTQVPIIAAKKRYMTVRECSRLQGLGNLKHLPPVSTRAYRALGNAVNADLVEMITERLVGRAGPRVPELTLSH